MKFFRVLVDGIPRLGEANDDLVSGRLYPEGLNAFAVIAQPSAADGDPVDFRAAELLPPFDVTTIRDFITFEQHTVGALRSVAGGKSVPAAWYDAPAFYFTNPHAATGHNSIVAVAPGSHQFDFELEVAVVIGKDGFNLSPEEAEEHIAGYMIMNDWSARDLQRHEMTVGLGPAKGKDTATSLGPLLVTKDEFDDVTNGGFVDLHMSVSINGQELATDSLANMAWNFPELISYASRGTWVRRGDILGSGTCGGGCLAEMWGWAGTMAPAPLQRDDVVSLTVERLGTLTNVIGEPAPVHEIPKARRRPFTPPTPYAPAGRPRAELPKPARHPPAPGEQDDGGYTEEKNEDARRTGVRMTRTDGERYASGLNVRQEVMGALHVERALGQASDFSRPLQELITEYAWGEIWGRPGLDRRIRSMLNLAMLTALNRSHELAGHVRGALNNGVTEQEIQELLLQAMIYCGAPAALESFRTAERVLTEVRRAQGDVPS